MAEFLSLIALNIKVTFLSFVEWIKVAYKFYYLYPHFRRADIYFLSLYLLGNPYKTSRKFLQKRGEKVIYAYGETPLTTMEMIADRAKIQEGDRLFELGCGRGRTCFWLHLVRGCDVVGIEWIPDFIVKAHQVQEREMLREGLEFRCEDLLESSLDGAEIVYVCGTTWDDPLIEKIAEKCAALPAGTKIITISYSLLPYSSAGAFEIVDRFMVPFLWGESEVFIQQIKRL